LIIEGFIEPTRLERMVYDKLKEIGITDADYPINPYEIIKGEGILLFEESFEDDDIRGILVNRQYKSGIIINSNRCEVSKRFIAAHELSHYWFHPRKTKTICLEDYSKSKKGIEWQANNAAAYALMPSKMVTELYDYCNGDVNYMCNFFKVAKDSMEYRIENLKLMPRIPFSNCLSPQSYVYLAFQQGGIGGWM